jgi:hypothetical protein
MAKSLIFLDPTDTVKRYVSRLTNSRIGHTSVRDTISIRDRRKTQQFRAVSLRYDFATRRYERSVSDSLRAVSYRPLY